MLATHSGADLQLFFTGGGLAKQPRPGFEGLAMDKAALESLTKALEYTFKDDGIHVGLVNVAGVVKDDSPKHSKELIVRLARHWRSDASRRKSSPSYTTSRPAASPARSCTDRSSTRARCIDKLYSAIWSSDLGARHGEGAELAAPRSLMEVLLVIVRAIGAELDETILRMKRVALLRPEAESVASRIDDARRKRRAVALALDRVDEAVESRTDAAALEAGLDPQPLDHRDRRRMSDVEGQVGDLCIGVGRDADFEPQSAVSRHIRMTGHDSDSLRDRMELGLKSDQRLGSA